MEAAIVNLTILALDQQQRGENGGGRRLMTNHLFIPLKIYVSFSYANSIYDFIAAINRKSYIYWCWQFLNDYIYDVVNSFIIKKISVLDYD